MPNIPTDQELKTIKNNFLVEMAKDYISLDSNNDLNENRRIVADYLANNPLVFLRFLSPTTLEFIKENYNKAGDEPLELPTIQGYNEDFLFLIRLGVIDINEYSYINHTFDKAYEALLNCLTSDLVKEINLANALKGLVDLYGYIGYEELKLIMLDIPEYKDIAGTFDFKDIIQRNGLIKYFCFANEDAYYRKEVDYESDLFLKLRTEFAGPFPFKKYTLEQIETFANTFSFTGVVDLDIAAYAPFHLAHALSFVLMFTANKEIAEKFNNEELEQIGKYEQSYPKWILKGNSLNDCVEYFKKIGAPNLFAPDVDNQDVLNKITQDVEAMNEEDPYDTDEDIKRILDELANNPNDEDDEDNEDDDDDPFNGNIPGGMIEA